MISHFTPLSSTSNTVEEITSNMMKFIVFSSLLAIVFAAPPSGSPKEIAIIAYENVVGDNGIYKYSYETADGTKAQESGQLNGELESVQGSYSFVGNDGITYSLSYTADENGFVPQASYLPVAPPIPEAIARSIAYNLAHPEEDKSQK